ncbi:hypothetical protein GCM10009646_78180 [Streptomyces aureus]
MLCTLTRVDNHSDTRLLDVAGGLSAFWIIARRRECWDELAGPSRRGADRRCWSGRRVPVGMPGIVDGGS